MKQKYTLEEIPRIAKEIIESIDCKVILFNGEMGVGKTTLIKELVKQLGVKDIANSPTFSLVNEYISESNQIIYHFDFYRINSVEEAMDIGIEDYFYNDAWCFIEWGEKVENLLPLKTVNVNILANGDNERTIEIN
ncbi:tRNA (adenosine(37)-N6)-threonylcarbamoyltransferase complex ATPase subunit type 1 TsaE [Urechidicola croceus]|uniref:tRNA threonylcarbamoyladenosine biosynthesis protein TsaE n=1 Tax=Urechidicola croceus TaxID=1850246 RepID=A0A1D8P4X6_9FLAO|nr:tRNA (adenosine(37)-N6)-threonylcarbamoyltransferase complex ATPase subunit type 1 TsaE [Urechidicola croceus]AOW19639.1 tRNA (adenosine(37)-N6)-threonylcarbamoyltransferase complex ATPase subunit type 1 TsaE [Urechidicola croceus]